MNGEYELDELKRYLAENDIQCSSGTYLPFEDRYIVFYLDDKEWLVEIQNGLTLFIDDELVGIELEASQIIERIENGIDDE